MSTPGLIKKYLSNYAVSNRWHIKARSLEGIDNVVIIPALAESEHLFQTLASLSNNPMNECERTLVVSVVNNAEAGKVSASDLADNRKTLEKLEALVECPKNALRLAYVDASSSGLEMPDKNTGVGLARKIGMDLALGIFDYDDDRPKLLFCLDADTLVEPDYLYCVRNAFEGEKMTAAVIAFSHQQSQNPGEQAAICCYELFLRYYVLGLRYAGSPYAFHSIGSTMVCTAEAYAAVRGMNTRRAGEDFYFLDKLAKTGGIGKVTTTTVHPSSRASSRVPFGTGKRVIRFSEGVQDEYKLYNPGSFAVLREWLGYMESCGDRDTETILARAEEMHPSLEQFLRCRHFVDVWPRLVANSGDEIHLAAHFSRWFDGFETFKLIRHLTENGLPDVEMFSAVEKLMDMMGSGLPELFEPRRIPPIEDQLVILEHVMKVESLS